MSCSEHASIDSGALLAINKSDSYFLPAQENQPLFHTCPSNNLSYNPLTVHSPFLEISLHTCTTPQIIHLRTGTDVLVHALNFEVDRRMAKIPQGSGFHWVV